MGRFSSRNIGDATGYVLWDAPDELLRSISEEYVGACFRKLTEHLKLLGGRVDYLR